MRDIADTAKALFTPEVSNERPLVNYVWININKLGREMQGPLCEMRLENIERVVANANRYSDADFNIWLDGNLLNDSTRFWMQSLAYVTGETGNIRFRNLQDIALYSSDSFFVPPEKMKKSKTRSAAQSVYLRADYARILVLEHCLTSEPDRRYVVYSDMDCEDLKLAETVMRIRKNAIVINDTGFDEYTSNGYIGLDADCASIKAHFADLVKDTREQALKGIMGYPPFDAFLSRVNPRFRSIKDIKMAVLPPMYSKLKGSVFIDALGLG